ncbi:tetratricopeptide repeat protein, partial [Amycolatopsis kentuckyensis]|uniref:tetratricopeptide repeat protein n=1 Tax=Amycolatopsis kentuckyensis TaxID=218823 RepID=UPI001178BB48
MSASAHAETGGVAAGAAGRDIVNHVTNYIAATPAIEVREGVGAPIAVSTESARLAELVAVPLADFDATRQLRGRESIVGSFIRRFHESSDSGRIHLLHGLGGSGKTSIAAEIARQASQDDVTVWWVSAVDSASFVSGMHTVARLAGATTEELQPPAAADNLWRRLGALRKPWLLVVDNADDPRVLETTSDRKPGTVASGHGWIRPLVKGPGLVVVTSRRGPDPVQWGKWIVSHPVKMLDSSDGAKILFDYTRGRGGSEAEARRLAERLGGLPLALSLAGSYLAEAIRDPWSGPATVTTFDRYRAALDEGRVDVLEPSSGEDSDQPGERDSRQLIDGIWQLATELLKSRNLPLAGPFMRLLSQFANTPIPYQLLLSQATLTSSRIFAHLDHAQIRSLLRYTADLDLIDLPSIASTTEAAVNTEPPVLYVHPLMRDASHRYRDPLHGDVEYLVLASRLLVDATAAESDTSPQDHRRWPTWHLLAPHAFHLTHALPLVSELDFTLGEQLAHTVDLATQYLFYRGLRNQAEVEFKKLYSICRETLGIEHPQTLSARHGSATILKWSGNSSEAQIEFENIFEARSRVLGDEHADTLIARHSLASVLRDRANYADSQAEYQATVEIQRRTLGNEHPNTLTTRHNLAGVLRDRGNYADAQTEYQAIIEIQRRVLGDEHPDTLAARHSHAGVLRDRGNYADAQAEYQAVLETQRRVMDDEHPDTLVTRHNLAGVLRDRGNYADAQAEYQAILEIECRVLGTEHPHTLTTRHNLAGVLQDLGNHADAQTE